MALTDLIAVDWRADQQLSRRRSLRQHGKSNVPLWRKSGQTSEMLGLGEECARRRRAGGERERESGRGEEDEAKSSKVFSKNAASVHELAVIQTSENATPSLTRIARPVIRRRSDRAREHPPSNHRSRADRSPDPAM